MVKLSFLNARLGLLLGCTVAALPAACLAQTDTPIQQRRIAVLNAGQKGAAGLPMVQAALKDPNALVRRAATQALIEIGAPAKTLLLDILKTDADNLARRTALRGLLAQNDSAQTMMVIETALADADERVRVTAVEALTAIRPHTRTTAALLEKAQHDRSPLVSRLASQAAWPFKDEVMALRETPQYKDTPLSVAQTIPLPTDGWLFTLDEPQTGHTKNWFAPDFKADGWKTLSIGKAWEDQIGKPYDGVAWYRHSFILPAKPQQVGTDLVFEAVDESAWIWVNGKFIGQHDLDLDGWDKRFAVDVSNVLKWGETNQITVRVLDRMYAGGIWKPVYLEVLKK